MSAGPSGEEDGMKTASSIQTPMTSPGQGSGRGIEHGSAGGQHESQPTIKVYREGPYLVRGPVVIIDQDGRELEVRRRIVPLCRCGRSRTKPLCDGAHDAGPSDEAGGEVRSHEIPLCGGARPDIEHLH